MNFIVADSSPLIAFARSDYLDLVRTVAGTIQASHTVWQIPAVGPILDQWISFGYRYRLSNDLVVEVLRRANEEL